MPFLFPNIGPPDSRRVVPWESIVYEQGNTSFIAWTWFYYRSVGCGHNRYGSVLAAAEVPLTDAYGFVRLFRQIAITLIAPFVVGLSLILLSRFQKLENLHGLLPVFINRLGIGSLHAVWVLPVLFLSYEHICMEPGSLLFSVFGRFCS